MKREPLMSLREFLWIVPRGIAMAFAIYYGTLSLILLNYPRRCG